MSITLDALENSLIGYNRRLESHWDGVEKMNAFETYIAIIKGYVGAGILFMPKNFSNGGWAFSTLCLVISCWLSTICAIKLIHLG